LCVTANRVRDFRFGSKPGITAAQHGRPLYPEELTLLTKLISVGHEKKFSNFADMRVCLPHVCPPFRRQDAPLAKNPQQIRAVSHQSPVARKIGEKSYRRQAVRQRKAAKQLGIRANDGR
jgi:hypothetical protein